MVAAQEQIDDRVKAVMDAEAAAEAAEKVEASKGRKG